MPHAVAVGCAIIVVIVVATAPGVVVAGVGVVAVGVGRVAAGHGVDCGVDVVS